MLGRLPVTVELGVLTILIGLVIALPVGIYSAVRQYTAADYVGRSVAIMGLATPNFWLGTMVMIYPAIWWALVAADGAGAVGPGPAGQPRHVPDPQPDPRDLPGGPQAGLRKFCARLVREQPLGRQHQRRSSLVAANRRLR